MNGIQTGHAGGNAASPGASSASTVASGGGPVVGISGTASGRVQAEGLLKDAEVTVTYQCTGIDAWEMQIAVQCPANVDLTHLVMAVPYSCIALELSDGAGEGRYQSQRHKELAGIGDAYEIPIDDLGEGTLTVSLSGISGVDPEGGSIGLRAGGEAAAVSGLPAFIP
jgi:hypothetical protein